MDEGCRATPDGPPTVDLPELHAHAAKVAQLRQPLDLVAATVRRATPPAFDLAFGVACRPFAARVAPVREWAQTSVDRIATSVGATSDELIRAVDRFDRTDRPHAHYLRAIAAHRPNANTWLANAAVRPRLDGVPAEGGGGLLDTGRALHQEITGSSARTYRRLAGQFAALGLDGGESAADLVEPLAAAPPALGGHLRPLRLLLDSLTGHPELVASSARTWADAGTGLTWLGRCYAAAVATGTGAWPGGSDRASTARTTIDALLAAGQLADTMSVVVSGAGELVDLVRAGVRDQVAGLGRRLAAAPTRAGAQADIVRTTRTCRELVEFMVALVETIGGQLPKVAEAYRTVAAAVPGLDER